MGLNAKEVISLCRNISIKGEKNKETCKQYYLRNKEIVQEMTRAQYKNLSQEEQDKKKRGKPKNNNQKCLNKICRN